MHYFEDISKSFIHRILSKHLQMCRICSTWVPHFLACKQMEHCVEVAKVWVQRVRRDRNFLSKVITCDETWVHYFNPKSQYESKVWRTSASPKTKRVCQQKLDNKVMLCVFFDTRGVIYQHVLPPKAKINAVYNVQVLKSLQNHVNEKRPEIDRLWILLQDNARKARRQYYPRFLGKGRDTDSCSSTLQPRSHPL